MWKRQSLEVSLCPATQQNKPALQPLIWCSEGLASRLSSSPEECFFTDTGMTACPPSAQRWRCGTVATPALRVFAGDLSPGAVAPFSFVRHRLAPEARSRSCPCLRPARISRTRAAFMWGLQCGIYQARPRKKVLGIAARSQVEGAASHLLGSCPVGFALPSRASVGGSDEGMPRSLGSPESTLSSTRRVCVCVSRKTGGERGLY